MPLVVKALETISKVGNANEIRNMFSNRMVVLANSLVASILTVLHGRQLYARAAGYTDPALSKPDGALCYAWPGDVLVVGIIANYAAVAADTFSSELGILSAGEPRLLTSWTLRKVPRGTNGGVSLIGLAAGLFGSILMVTTAMVFLPTCTEQAEASVAGSKPWTMEQRRVFMAILVGWGFAGTILDSILGGLFQRSVKDSRSGKIVEGDGGRRALVSDDSTDKKTDEKPSRVIESGLDLLDNNDVNFLTAVVVSVGAMATFSWYWDIPVQSILAL